ncbi:MAG: phosphopentomutase [bacterium]|nr:phosphopentomutase [bacterium]
MKRAVILLLDGVGCGALPDAIKYGDENSNTLGNLANQLGGLDLPVLQSLGLGNIISIKGVPLVDSPLASYGKAAELSAGKDSTIGHWELTGVVTSKPFPVFLDGFPEDMLKRFSAAIPQGNVLGGGAASGTEIIARLGDEHIKTGYPIVYTSADSVFQIAAHKSIIPLEELYRLCEIAREMFPDIGRIIARPFIGESGAFKRVPERRDYSLPPTGVTLLDLLKEKKFEVTTIGKVNYLFTNRGITESINTKDNFDVADKTMKTLTDKTADGIIFANFLDFDMLWGHRNDVINFAKGLEYFDKWLKGFLNKLDKEDILFITADHGNDPTTPSTDHSREYIPILVYGDKIAKGKYIGVRQTFADVGATIGQHFGIKLTQGKSFLSQILKH